MKQQKPCLLPAHGPNKPCGENVNNDPENGKHNKETHGIQNITNDAARPPRRSMYRFRQATAGEAPGWDQPKQTTASTRKAGGDVERIAPKYHRINKFEL